MLSKWGKDVKKALIEREMTIRELGEAIGYGTSTVSSVIAGRYSNASYKEIVSKINKVLGTKGLPKRISTPSEEWRCAVKTELIKRNLTLGKLAKEMGVTRDRMSLIVNGKSMNKEIVQKVNEFLDIKINAVSSK